MDNTTEDVYLQKVEELVYDEDKIVSYIWLSTKLGISVRDAKLLLEKYVKNNRQLKPKELGVTQLIMGYKKDQGLSVTLTRDDELEEKRREFSNILSEHIYSVQKSKEVDLKVLSLVEPFNINELREKPLSGSVVSKNCIKRILKIKKVVPQVKPTNTQKTPFTKNTLNNGIKQNENKTEEQDKTKVDTKNKQNGITNFFSKGPLKSENDIKEKNSNKGAKQKQNGIMANFFSKPSGKSDNKKIVPENDDSNKEKIGNVSNEENINNVKDEPMEISDDGEPVVKKNKTKETPKQNKKNKRRRKDGSSDQPQKKRKRIIERQDSDSDDIFGNDEENNEEIIEPSEDERDPEPVYKSEPILAPKNKKRKQVSRTYKDDEGYFITRNEWVYESASDDEENEKEQKPQNEIKPKTEEILEYKENNKIKDVLPEDEKKNGKTRNISPSKPVKNKGKNTKNSQNQQTLMSFFKKM